MLRPVSFLKCLFVISTVFIVSISLVSNASAYFVFSGSVDMIGNDPCNATGSYKIQVVYSMYDGRSSSDPLGLTSNLQLAFNLTHLGSDGEMPALNVGRFIVYAPASVGAPPYITAFYKSISAVGTGTAPSGPGGIAMDIDPPPSNANRGKFLFEDSIGSPTFAAGYTSQTLVLTAVPGSFPVSGIPVILEIDTTSTSPSIKSDVTVNIAPEPASMVLFGVASLLSLRRRRKI